MMMKLPNGFAARPASVEDIQELAALDAAHTRHAVGKALRTENEIRIEWKAPMFDAMTDSQVLCTPQGRIVGWCEVYDQAPHVRISSRLRLLPDLGAEREPVARALVEWCADRARTSIERAPGRARVVLTQGAYDGEPAALTRLEAAGFHYVRSFLRMRIEMSELPLAPEWPEGIDVRVFEKGRDDRPAVRAMIEAFRDHWGFVETPFEEELEEWKQWIYEDDDFDTDLWFLAMDGNSIAGFCQCYPIAGEDASTGLVDELGVLKSWRRRGLASALLHHAFRAFYERGTRNAELGVDSESLTGATRLYEGAGMSLVWKNNVYELELRAGTDTTTHELEAD